MKQQKNRAPRQETSSPRKLGCPIPSTHSRLQQAHRLWHQAADSYTDPSGFRANLNSTLESLRSVTWVLQKEHQAVEGFKEWYESWQERMRNDPIMRWLVEARNKVIKQGELEARSTARATIRSYDDHAILELEVSPIAETQMIAADIATNRLSLLPPQLKSSAFLTVERRWVVEDLPDHEVLEALSHCYGVLSQIVAEAHERANARFVVCDASTGEVNIPTKHLGGKLPCMVLDRDHRTVLVSLASGQLVTPYNELVKYDPDEGDKVAKRDRPGTWVTD
jgi:hypothetical protein